MRASGTRRCAYGRTSHGEAEPAARVPFWNAVPPQHWSSRRMSRRSERWTNAYVAACEYRRNSASSVSTTRKRQATPSLGSPPCSSRSNRWQRRRWSWFSRGSSPERPQQAGACCLPPLWYGNPPALTMGEGAENVVVLHVLLHAALNEDAVLTSTSQAASSAAAS